ncbi:unnamed protein product [Euphydryas editha]|uniref:Uncharacterized protein n=1 Tax=Euphydryas editha TaxID=104508 RepID=A0AAU9U9R9_EUPED|nr:unnamed protein product [Euphydryas editha]
MAENNGEAGEAVGQFYFDGTYTFNGEGKTYSLVKWAQDFDDNADVFSWTEWRKLVIARRSLCGTVGLWVKTEKVFKSYKGFNGNKKGS